MWDVWHTQLRAVHEHFPEVFLRARRSMQDKIVGHTFVYVTRSVQHRATLCPANVVQEFRDKGYTIIHIQEPQ